MASRAGASASDAIFVAVRVRPFSVGERRGDGRSMVSVVDDKMICFDPPSNGGAATAAEGRRMGVRVARNRRYAYDHVFDADAGQEAVFRVTTRPLIDEVVKGLNATVLAYGATGSGKTHTMVGSTAGGAGVMVLAIESLFECMRKATDARFALELSYLEVDTPRNSAQFLCAILRRASTPLRSTTRRSATCSTNPAPSRRKRAGSRCARTRATARRCAG